MDSAIAKALFRECRGKEMPSVDLARRVAGLSRTDFRMSDFVCNFALVGTDRWINLPAKAFVSLGESRHEKSWVN